MEDGDIIVIDKVEDDSYDSKDFKKVTDKAGNTFNVKYGQGGKLKEKWHLLQEGVAIKLKVGTYNNKPFVKDFEVVKDVFVKQAAEKAQVSSRHAEEEGYNMRAAFKGMIELMIADKLDEDEQNVTLGWAMARLDLPRVIVTKIEEAKGETTKDTKGNQEAQGELTDRQDSRETTDGEPKTVSEFLMWLKNHNIKAPRTFLEVEYKVGTGKVLTIKKCQELYNQIKEKFNN